MTLSQNALTVSQQLLVGLSRNRGFQPPKHSMGLQPIVVE